MATKSPRCTERVRLDFTRLHGRVIPSTPGGLVVEVDGAPFDGAPIVDALFGLDITETEIDDMLEALRVSECRDSLPHAFADATFAGPGAITLVRFSFPSQTASAVDRTEL
jgi:hypothetical protein